MGRIKTTLIKRITKDIMKQASGKFTTDFEKNKKLLTAIVELKKMKKIKNSVAGYITRLKQAELKLAATLK